MNIRRQKLERPPLKDRSQLGLQEIEADKENPEDADHQAEIPGFCVSCVCSKCTRIRNERARPKDEDVEMNDANNIVQQLKKASEGMDVDEEVVTDEAEESATETPKSKTQMKQNDEPPEHFRRAMMDLIEGRRG